jgi:hypothetical protein
MDATEQRPIFVEYKDVTYCCWTRTLSSAQTDDTIVHWIIRHGITGPLRLDTFIRIGVGALAVVLITACDPKHKVFNPVTRIITHRANKRWEVPIRSPRVHALRNFLVQAVEPGYRKTLKCRVTADGLRGCDNEDVVRVPPSPPRHDPLQDHQR